ncbi:MAG: DUF4296 domain-containing protein [Saprospiraceae bacterium]|nr:DUF4296 domain-containing protein [Saprospiraceae bacterium]
MWRLIAAGILILSFLSCRKKETLVLQIPEEKMVSILADIYAAKAAANQNDPDFRDSTTREYLKQIGEIHGYSYEQIQSELELLYRHRDTLTALQNKALDTLRAMNERQYQQQFYNPLSTGIINN